MSADLPPLAGNPLADEFEKSRTNPSAAAATREAMIRRYGFAIPTEAALQCIAVAAASGIVEIGAGAGYWARLLFDRGLDVVAYDPAPPPSAGNRWFAGIDPWFPVAAGDHTVVECHADRTLLLVWPTRNEQWAADASTLFHRHGGQHLAYVGERPGGRTGDDALHARLGGYDRCYKCAYDLADAACVCDIERQWELQATVELPHWDGFDDNLHLYRRLSEHPTGRRRRYRHRGVTW